MAIADVLDALLARRACKAPGPLRKVLEYLGEQHAAQFDPASINMLSEDFAAFTGI